MFGSDASARATRPAPWWRLLLLACWLALSGAAVQAAPLPADAGAHRHHAALSAAAAADAALAGAEASAVVASHDPAAHAAHEPGHRGDQTGASCPCHAACAALPVQPHWAVARGVESYRAIEPKPEPGRAPAPEPRPPRS